MLKYTWGAMKKYAMIFCLLFLTTDSIEKTALTVHAAEGQEEADVADWKMIDHIELKGGWEREFYDRLVEEASDDGALIDISKGKDYYGDGSLALDVMEFSGRESSPEAVEKACIAKRDEEKKRIYAVFRLFILDHPEVFWINWTFYSVNVIWQYQGMGNEYTYQANLIMMLKDEEYDFDIRFPEYRTPEAIKEGIKIREEKIAEILTKTKGMSKAEKVVFFNRYLAMTNEYNTSEWIDLSMQDNEEGHEAYDRIPAKAKGCLSALEGTKGEEGPNCVGYSKAFQVLCDRSDIPCIYVSGASVSDDGEKNDHGWNNVCLDGKWYGMDVQGDDMDFEDYSVEDHAFLLVGSETMIDGMTFGESHVLDEDEFIQYPVLSPCRYEFSPFSYKLEADGQMNGYYNTDDVKDALEHMAEKAEAPDVITVTGNLSLNDSVLDIIKGKDITVQFQDGKDGMSWSVNGKSVIEDYESENRISARNMIFESFAVKKSVYEATGRRDFLHIVSDRAVGEKLGYTAELSINLKAENAGLYVNRFSCDPKKVGLEFISSEQIPADGIIHISSEKTINNIFTVSDQPLDGESLQK